MGYVNSSSGLQIKNALIKDKTNEAKSIKRLCIKLKEEYEEVESHFSVLDELWYQVQAFGSLTECKTVRL